MNDLLAELILYLKTKEALGLFIRRIDDALLLMSTSPDLSQLNGYFTMKEVQMITRVVQSITDLRALKEELSRVSVFTIRIAFTPSAFFENILIDSIIHGTKSPCVAQLIVDRHVLGGAVIDFQGKYRDFSVKSQIEDWRMRSKINYV